MTALLNPNLRDAGASPGAAAKWSIASVCAAQRIAAFEPVPAGAVENFERWSALLTTFVDGDVVFAIFDGATKDYEAFDGWVVGPFIDAFPDVLLVADAFGGATIDTFDAWLATPWSASWADVAGESALFAGAPVDDFESWLSPLSPAWARAAFDSGADAIEAFAATWAAMTTM